MTFQKIPRQITNLETKFDDLSAKIDKLFALHALGANAKVQEPTNNNQNNTHGTEAPSNKVVNDNDPAKHSSNDSVNKAIPSHPARSTRIQRLIYPHPREWQKESLG